MPALEPEIEHFVMAITSAETIVWHTTPLMAELPHVAVEHGRNSDAQNQSVRLPLLWSRLGWDLALEHPHDLLICVTVRLNMHAGPDAPPYEHPLITGENAAADLFADLFLR
jgi:hypothetical protein